MTATETELHPCACGDPECREMTRATYARGHAAKARKFSNPPLLPGPDDDLDLGILDLGETGTPSPGPTADAPAPPEPSPPDDHEPPVRPLGFPPPGKTKPGKPSRQPPRVTIATRKDIAAKVQLMLYIPGQVWATRDPWCGGMFVNQIPPVTDALTDIICQSADLVAFFTGPAGGFMIWLNLLTALQPVAVTAWQHHIAHTLGGPESNGQAPTPDMAAYAA